jgi:hypothetical protein
MARIDMERFDLTLYAWRVSKDRSARVSAAMPGAMLDSIAKMYGSHLAIPAMPTGMFDSITKAGGRGSASLCQQACSTP